MVLYQSLKFRKKVPIGYRCYPRVARQEKKKIIIIIIIIIIINIAASSNNGAQALSGTSASKSTRTPMENMKGKTMKMQQFELWSH